MYMRGMHCANINVFRIKAITMGIGYVEIMLIKCWIVENYLAWSYPIEQIPYHVTIGTNKDGTISNRMKWAYMMYFEFSWVNCVLVATWLINEHIHTDTFDRSFIRSFIHSIIYCDEVAFVTKTTHTHTHTITFAHEPTWACDFWMLKSHTCNV